MELEYYSESGMEVAYAHEGDAGLDLPIWDDKFGEEFTIQPGESILVKTGVYMNIKEGYYGMLDTRSSTSKVKLDLLCRTIDNPYRGNIRLSLINLNSVPVTLKQGMKVAQIIIKPYTKVTPKRVNSIAELGTTDRADKGFGSTGGGVTIDGEKVL